jgi:hypothetical protein
LEGGGNVSAMKINFGLRSLDRLWAALGAALFCWLSPAHADSKTRPNILFIMSDDHAAHAISAYGSKVNQQPPPGSD